MIVDQPSTATNLAQLIVDRLEEVVPVHRAVTPLRPPGGYCIVYFNGGQVEGETLASVPGIFKYTFRSVCVGYTDVQCLEVVDLVRAQLTDWKPLDRPGSGKFREVVIDAPLLRDSLRQDKSAPDVRFAMALLWRVSITRRI